jgi:hypothetical protein
MTIQQTFTFIFTGRQSGAIGECHMCRKTVTAPDIVAAKLKLYDTHEHISDLRLALFDINPLEATK